MNKKKKVMVSLITTLLIVIVLIGIAYALLRFKLNGEKNQVLRIGDLELKLDETGNTLGLESGDILTDEEGLELNGFDFTLKNDSTKTVDYTIYLDDVELDFPTDIRLDDKYLKYSLDKNGTKGEVKPLSDTGVNPKRVLEQGKIGKNQQNDYTLRIWVTSDVDGDITDQVFKAKIRVENTLIPNDINIDNNNIVLDLNRKTEEQINLNKEELGEVSYRSLDSQVADVSPEGLITAVGLGSTEIEVTSGNYQELVSVKVQKTVEATYVKQGLGVQEIDKEKDSCILTSKDEVCEKTLPTITLKSDEYTAVGWNELQDAEDGTTGNITFQDNVTYYAISYKNEVPYKILFNGNGNTIDGEEKECSLPRSYNDIPQPTSCTVTTPTITVNANTPTIIGYSTDASTHEKVVGSNEELEVSEENNGTTYYAQTKADEKTYHITYEKTTGVKEIGQESDQCTIKETFNGEVQGTSCTVEAPSITAESGYDVIGWSTNSSGGDEIEVGQTITLSQESNTYYAIVKNLGPAAGTNGISALLDFYTNDEATQDYDLEYTKEDSTAKENKMYVFNHTAGTQQSDWSSDELKDYRYIGADPNNYVTFNGEEAGWRIIGIETVDDGTGKREKRIKLIRKNFLPVFDEEAIYYGQLPWDNKASGTGSSASKNGSNDWTDSRLMMLLNPNYENDPLAIGGSLYWNRQSGECPYSENDEARACDFSGVGLLPEAREMIGDAKWFLSGTKNYTSTDNGTANHFYSYERGETVYSGASAVKYPRKTNWTGKVGLMYPSDYGYATSGGSSANRETCLAKELYYWNSDCENNDWLYKNGLKYYNDYDKDQWTITPYTDLGYSFFYITSYKEISHFTSVNHGVVRPTVYLKADTLYQSGDGSSSNPFVFTSSTSSDQGIEGPSSISITSNKKIVSSPTKVCQEEVSTGTSYNFDIDSTTEIKTGSVCTTSNGNVVCTDYNSNINTTSNKSCMSGNNVTSYTKSNDSCSYVYVCDNNNKCSAKREC